MEPKHISALRQTLIDRQSKLRKENTAIENRFKSNSCELESIRRQLKDLEPIQ